MGTCGGRPGSSAAQRALANAFGIARKVHAGAFIFAAGGLAALLVAAQAGAVTAHAGQTLLADVGRPAAVAQPGVGARRAGDGTRGIDDLALSSGVVLAALAGEGVASADRKAQVDPGRDDLTAGPHVQRADAALSCVARCPIPTAAELVAGAERAVEPARAVALCFTGLAGRGVASRLAPRRHRGIGGVELRAASFVFGATLLGLVVAVPSRALSGAVGRLVGRRRVELELGAAGRRGRLAG